MQWWFYAHETRQKTIKNALFHAHLFILPEKNVFFIKMVLRCHQVVVKENRK
jgi:hypothetical protein